MTDVTDLKQVKVSKITKILGTREDEDTEKNRDFLEKLIQDATDELNKGG